MSKILNIRINTVQGTCINAYKKYILYCALNLVTKINVSFSITVATSLPEAKQLFYDDYFVASGTVDDNRNHAT